MIPLAAAASCRRFPGRRDWAWLAAALLLLYTFCLGTRGLNEPDEGRYAEIALTMAAPGGDWWEPRMSGWGHYDKPPLIYWATALSVRAFGRHEWAARLPALLGAALALGGLGWAAARLRGPRVAWVAVLVCGTSVQFWLLGRVLTPDMLLCGWTTVAIAAWAESRHRAGAAGFWWVSLGCWTLAWWTKATPGLVPLVGLAVGTWVTGDASGRKALRIGLLVPAILILGSPWYVSMLARYPDLKPFFLGRELAGRIAGRVDGRQGPLLYYLPVSLVGWLPWWPVAAWWAAREGRGSPARDRREVWRGWTRRLGIEGWIVIVGLIFFSLCGSKLATYTLPLAPWAALLMARAIAQGGERTAERLPRRLVVPAATFAAVAATGVLLFPRVETRLGVNSSLCGVCRFLAQHHAPRVDVDHYWPGLEFYLPDTPIYYVIGNEAARVRKARARRALEPARPRFQERPSDGGLPPRRFTSNETWPMLPSGDPRAASLNRGEVWFVRFVGQKDSPFDELIRCPPSAERAELMATEGDFRIYRTTLPRREPPDTRQVAHP